LENNTSLTTQKESKNIKIKYLFLLIPIIIIIIVAASIGSYYIYPYYQSKRYLKQAQSFTAIGDYEQSKKYFKLYLLNNPEDVAIKKELAETYLKIKQYDEAIKLLKILKSELKTSKKKDLQKPVDELLYLTNHDLAEEYKNKAEEFLSEKKYKEARNSYELQLSYIKEYKLLSTSFSKDSEPPNLILLEVLNTDLLVALANLAFTYWLEDNYEKSKEVISDILLWCYGQESFKVINKRYAYFGSKVEELASFAFDKKDYKMARKHYKGALFAYENDSSESAISQIPRLRYNIAMTYFNQENFWHARKLLKEIKKDYPKYETNNIDKKIELCLKDAFLKGGFDELKQGSEYFEKKDWANARSSYREAIKSFKKSGANDISDLIALARYNIAVTYWNQKNWAKAKAQLLLVREKHPNYMKEEVDDMIYKTISIDRFSY
jgi:tetratricopeptide (TPR) repeat protein